MKRRAAAVLAAVALGFGMVGVGVPDAGAAGSTRGISPSSNYQRFNDTPAGYDFFRDVSWLADSGITNGWDDGTFRPYASINRDAFAAFLYRMAGSPAVTPPARSPFRDVPTDYVFYKEISWLASKGVTRGWNDHTFRPHQPIGRDAIAAFLYRFACEPNFTQTKTFKDVGKNEHRKAIAWMASTGISTGWADGTFRPANKTERGAMAAFLHRFQMTKGISARPACETSVADKTTNILLMGSDSRNSAQSPLTWGHAGSHGERADTMLLVQISNRGEHMVVMSIPRSVAAVMPSGDRKGRSGLVMGLNMAYEGGGTSEQVMAVENLLGIRIDHWVLTDFTAFAKMVDGLGGVKVKGAKATLDGDGKVALPAGFEGLVSGTNALRYVRARKNLPEDDLDRVVRAQYVIKQFHQNVFAGNLANPAKLGELYDFFKSGYVATDSRLTKAKALELAQSVSRISPDQVMYVSAPTAATRGRTDSDPSGKNASYAISYFDWKKMTPFSSAWAAGQAYDYLATHSGFAKMTNKTVIQ